MTSTFPRKIILVSLGLALLAAFSLPPAGRAQGTIYGDRVPAGQVAEQNMILNGTDVSIDGTVNGDVVAIGDTITLNGQVNGSLVAFGNSIVLNGQVSSNVLAAGVMMELESGGEIGRDLYFAGARLTLADGSSIQRDLNLVGLEAQFAGEVGRKTSAIIGPLQIAELIFEPIREQITIISRVSQETVLHASAPMGEIKGAGLLVSGPYWLAGEPQTGQQIAQIDQESLKTWGTALIRNLVALLVIGLLGIWLVPIPLNWAANKIQEQTGWVTLSGLIFFIGGWFVTILSLALVVMLALFLLSLSLPNLGFLTGALGLTGVGLGFSVFWLSITYVSKIVFALLVGRLLLQRLSPGHAQSSLWTLILGIVLYALVASIPYLGWVVATLVTFLGSGALWAVSYPLFSRREAVESAPALAQAD